MDRKFFPYKYQIKESYDAKNHLKTVSELDAIFDFAISILTWLFLAIYILAMWNELSPFFGGAKPLSYLFGDALWTIHIVFLMILVYNLYQLYKKLFVKS